MNADADERGPRGIEADGGGGSGSGSGGDDSAATAAVGPTLTRSMSQSAQSVSSKLEAASKPQLIALLTKQMTRIREADKRATELSSQLAGLHSERDEERQARQRTEADWQAALQATQADLAQLRQQLQSAHSHSGQEAPAQHDQQQANHSPPQQPQSATNTATALDAAAVDSATEEDEQQRRLSVDVVELRHAAVVRSYEEKLAALNGTLVKYKGVTAKLHDKLKAMAEQLKAVNTEQAIAASQQAEAERVIHQRAEEMSVVLDIVDAVMGAKERAQWEADMRSEHEEQAARAATDPRSESSEGEQHRHQSQDHKQQRADGETGVDRTSARHTAGLVNGAGSAVSSEGSLSRLSRLLAAVQRQGGEVRRMKEESLGQLLVLSQAHQTTQHKSAYCVTAPELSLQRKADTRTGRTYLEGSAAHQSTRRARQLLTSTAHVRYCVQLSALKQPQSADAAVGWRPTGGKLYTHSPTAYTDVTCTRSIQRADTPTMALTEPPRSADPGPTSHPLLVWAVCVCAAAASRRGGCPLKLPV